jgi:hypothetical protein
LSHDWELCIAKSKSNLLYDRWFTANQFVLVLSPLRFMTRDPPQLSPCSYNTYGLSLMSMLGLSPSILHIALIACYWKFFVLHYIQVLCQYRLCKADLAHLIYLILQQQLSHLNGSNHSHDFVWLLLVACTILLYNRIHTEGWKPCVNRGPVCTL